MKKYLSLILIFTVAIIINRVNGQAGNNVTELILKSYSARNFTSDAVSDQDINLILKCGIKAPSSRNGQQWRFTVVKDTALTRAVIGNIKPGNVLIMISGPVNQQEAHTADFDCALAAENMNIAAQSLGLGARIYGGPVGVVNASLKESLQIPAGYGVITILRIGHIENNTDALSSASARKSFEEIVNFR